MDSLMKAHADFINASKRHEEAQRDLSEAVSKIEKTSAEVGSTKERLQSEIAFYLLNKK